MGVCETFNLLHFACGCVIKFVSCDRIVCEFVAKVFKFIFTIFFFAEFKPKQKNTVAKVLWLVLLSGK